MTRTHRQLPDFYPLPATINEVGVEKHAIKTPSPLTQLSPEGQARAAYLKSRRLHETCVPWQCLTIMCIIIWILVSPDSALLMYIIIWILVSPDSALVMGIIICKYPRESTIWMTVTLSIECFMQTYSNYSKFFRFNCVMTNVLTNENQLINQSKIIGFSEIIQPRINIDIVNFRANVTNSLAGFGTFSESRRLTMILINGCLHEWVTHWAWIFIVNKLINDYITELC